MASESAAPHNGTPLASVLPTTPLAQAFAIHNERSAVLNRLALLKDKKDFYERVGSVELRPVGYDHMKVAGVEDAKTSPRVIGLFASQPAKFYDYLNNDEFITSQQGAEREFLAAFVQNTLLRIDNEILDVEAKVLELFGIPDDTDVPM